MKSQHHLILVNLWRYLCSMLLQAMTLSRRLHWIRGWPIRKRHRHSWFSPMLPKYWMTTTLLCWNDTQTFYMTDPTSNLDSIDEACHYTFTKRGRSMDAIRSFNKSCFSTTYKKRHLSSFLMLKASFRYTP